MNEELEVLSIVTRALNGSGIAYMITGSVAMNYYAFPRMTRDIDIVIELHRKDLTTFVGLFKNDFYLSPDAIEEAITNREMFNIIHNKYVMKLDFIVKKPSKYLLAEFQRRQQIIIQGIPMWIASPEDLILSKLWWAKDTQSELQICDVKNLLSSVDSLDIAYINRWVEEMHLQAIYRKTIDA